MKVRTPRTVLEAEAIQDELRSLLDLTDPGPAIPPGSREWTWPIERDRLAAAVAVLDGTTLEVVEEVTVGGRVTFDYVPGLLAFREIPALLEALDRLTVAPELIVCDGYGLAHPRRFGLACHLGVLTGLPTIGVGKTTFVGTYPDPAPERGSWTDLTLDGDVVGRVLRTAAGGQTGLRLRRPPRRPRHGLPQRPQSDSSLPSARDHPRPRPSVTPGSDRETVVQS